MMRKERKGKKSKYQNEQCKHNYEYWWIVCVYLFVPIFILLIFSKVFTPLLQNYMVGVDIGGSYVLNSDYTMDNVVAPFIKSAVVIIGVIVSYLILGVFQKKILEAGIYFIEIRKFLKCFEIIIVLLALIIAVYGSINSFDYSQYGYNVYTIKDALAQEGNVINIPLEKIPSIHSIGISTEEGNLLYNILVNMSQFAFLLLDNLEIFIAVAAAVIIPMKNYSEKVYEIKNS